MNVRPGANPAESRDGDDHGLPVTPGSMRRSRRAPREQHGARPVAPRWVGGCLTTRVVVVDDVADIRWLLRAVLNADDRFEVVGEAGDGAEGVRIVQLTRPDVVVLDLRMPEMDGLEAAEEIAKLTPQARVVIYSGADADTVNEAVEAVGVAGFIEKGAPPRRIVEAVARAACT